MSKGVTRLYRQFVPSHYQLSLDLNEDLLEFSGSVKVSGQKVGRPSKRLTLHQKGLRVTSAKVSYLSKTGEQRVNIIRVNTQKSFDELRLHSDRLIMPGRYSIELEFSGSITKQMHGIYPCFFDYNDAPHKLIATQFESHHAREAFPCIDEPEAKATFDLTLKTKKDQTVLGNTPLKSQQVQDDRLVSTFETSPLMSSYLLAFVVGEMHKVSTKTKAGVEINAWASLAQPKNQLQYAAKEAAAILDFYSDYFQVPFPLPKLDQVALPDFEAGAMENWGLITYRESALLVDPVNRSLSSEEYVTSVIAHEISHQWFGDLVTMKWWDDLWLNESFASLMENVAQDKLHPRWQPWEDFTSSFVLTSSNRDIYKDVQPVSLKVHHPDEIESIFDPAIVYAKGARLLSMLLEFIGEDTFRKGLKLYFKKHAYSTTVGNDLWSALSQTAGQNIRKLMDPWVKQSGQPLISVKLADGKLTLHQQRFLVDGSDQTSLWPIPLLAEPATEPNVLTLRSQAFDYPEQTAPLINASGRGHYITYYENAADRANLEQQIINLSVSSSGRIILLNDMLLLARLGKYHLTDLLNTVKQASQEPRDAVWDMLSRVIGVAQSLTSDDHQFEQPIKQYKAKLAAYWYDQLGWNEKPQDSPNTKHLRTTALALSLSGEYKPAVKQALKLFDETDSIAQLPAEQRSLITVAVVRRGRSKDIEALKSEYVTSPNPDVKMAIASGLCATKDTATAQQLIKWGLDQGGAVRPQDIATWFAYLIRNPYTHDITWNWFTKSWDYLVKLSGGGKYMGYFVWYSSSNLSTSKWLKQFKEFYTPKLEEPALKRSILIAFSEIEARVNWRRREIANLKSYFLK